MEALLHNLTLAQKVGQLFLIRCPQEEETAVVQRIQPAGLVLFSEDFEHRTAAQAAERIAAMQAVSRLPMLTTVDEEGETVCRISRHPLLRSQRFPSPRQLREAGGWEAVEADAQEKCGLLRRVGVNVNLAPVCDLSDNPAEFIYQRSCSGDAAVTGEFVRRVVTLSQNAGVGTVLKHFPGYGGNADTHTGMATDRRALAQFRQNDLPPFAAGVAAGCGAVMMSHNIICCVDDARPASLSPAMHDFLRRELHFDGVIITDDLQMGAIVQYTDGNAAAVQAVLAGNDLLCCSDWKTQVPAVLQAAEAGVISSQRLDQSVLRVLGWKRQLGLL